MRRSIVLVMVGTIVLAVTVIVGLHVGGWSWVARNVLPVAGGGLVGILISRWLLWRSDRDRKNRCDDRRCTGGDWE